LWNYNFSHEKRFQHFDVVERSPDHAYVIIVICEKKFKSFFLNIQNDFFGRYSRHRLMWLLWARPHQITIANNNINQTSILHWTSPIPIWLDLQKPLKCDNIIQLITLAVTTLSVLQTKKPFSLQRLKNDVKVLLIF
jgi:hypothetical protein